VESFLSLKGEGIMNQIFLMSLVLLFSGFAQAVEANPLDGLKLEVSLIAEGPEVDLLSTDEYLNRDACAGTRDDRFDVQELMTLGEKIWQIIKDGQPTLEFASNSVSAIPNGAVCPFNMSGWSIPQSKTYKLAYKNMFGMEMIGFTYKLIYSFGGSYLSKGAYLTNVAIHPADIHVNWGQGFNANVNVANVLNIGTDENPVAGMQVILEWNVGNVVNKFKSQRVYFVDGRGNVTEL
jgi:hypothetical protein